MTRLDRVSHRFVEFIPEQLEPATVYVSIAYATAVHLCCCGCRQEVVTPISKIGWTLSFDGESISLDPSIGNWSLPCKSHYWIRNNRVRWAPAWSKERIEAGRTREAEARTLYFNEGGAAHGDAPPPAATSSARRQTLRKRIGRWLQPPDAKV